MNFLLWIYQQHAAAAAAAAGRRMGTENFKIMIVFLRHMEEFSISTIIYEKFKYWQPANSQGFYPIDDPQRTDP